MICYLVSNLNWTDLKYAKDMGANCFLVSFLVVRGKKALTETQIEKFIQEYYIPELAEVPLKPRRAKKKIHPEDKQNGLL